MAAENILKETETKSAKNATYMGELIGHLTVAVVPTGTYVMPHFLSSLRRKSFFSCHQ